MARRYILFDLDRTLWDFDGNADRTYRAMFREYRLQEYSHVDYETFHERYQSINDMLWEAYRNGTISKEMLAIRRFSLTLAAFGCDPESPEIIRLSQKLCDYYVLEGTRQTGLMPGARELLEWLDTQRDRLSLAVITNGFSEAQLPKMRYSDIDRYFDYFFLSEDLGYMKPDRRFFEAALAKMGAKPDQCLVVGDDYKVDIAGAMAVGIPQVYYNRTGKPLPADSPKPTYEVRELMEIQDIVGTRTTRPQNTVEAGTYFPSFTEARDPSGTQFAGTPSSTPSPQSLRDSSPQAGERHTPSNLEGDSDGPKLTTR